jgi:hypothetical protein
VGASRGIIGLAPAHAASASVLGGGAAGGALPGAGYVQQRASSAVLRPRASGAAAPERPADAWAE